jgi:hypothetical protein
MQSTIDLLSARMDSRFKTAREMLNKLPRSIILEAAKEGQPVIVDVKFVEEALEDRKRVREYEEKQLSGAPDKVEVTFKPDLEPTFERVSISEMLNSKEYERELKEDAARNPEEFDSYPKSVRGSTIGN